MDKANMRKRIILSEVQAHLGSVVDVDRLDPDRVEHMARDIVQRLDRYDGGGGEG